jgi:ATP-binding cassette subfamily B protein
VIAAFGGESRFASDFGTSNDELYDASWRAQFISNTMMPTMMFLSNVSYVAGAVVGGLKVLNGTITLGEVQAFIQYSRQFNQPLAQLASMANLLQSGLASAERVFELLDEREERPDVVTGRSPPRSARWCSTTSRSPTCPAPGHHQPLVARAAPARRSPSWPHRGRQDHARQPADAVLRGGLGRILIDGVDTATVSRDDVRSRIGMVLQDTWLLEASIADNIAYARPEASQEEVLAAAVATNVDRLVRTLPDGYDTVVTDESISAGEKQLITIARAFLADPQILVLDEATSSVDTRTEVLVQHAMHALRQGRTSFIIAHRLSTIRDADLIVVMEHGDVVEQGTHEALLDAGGAYAALYQAQFEGAMTAE